MADKRSYETNVQSVSRKAGELAEYIRNASICYARTVQSKHDKLLKDLAELKRLGEVYIATLQGDDAEAVTAAIM